VRLFCIAAAICILSSVASAQSGLRSASLPNRTPTDPLPPPTILRSGSLPDRSPANPVLPPAKDVFGARPRTYLPHRNQIFFSPVVGYGYAPDVNAPYATRPAPDEPNGYLQIDIRPGAAQVTVDGMFMGSVDDFRRLVPGRSLEAGPHRVEIQAPGYETAAFDVRIFPRETVTYRQELRALQAAAQPSSTPALPKTFYVIPGCYAGDKPPREGMLPRGCSTARLRSVPPVVGAAARGGR
jgi:hypothetical protein